tara:strand:+ start:14827 stop:15060 length:234 start_codon:yes stop_codon:yes gene_type:complete
MASYKKKTGQTGDDKPSDWKDLVVEETKTVNEEKIIPLTYKALETELAQQKVWEKEVTDKIAELESQMAKVKGIADK